MYRYAYSGKMMIDKEDEQKFYSEQKQELNDLERLALDMILQKFIDQYEIIIYGEPSANKISDYTRYNKAYVDILDGCYDTYVFDGCYAINKIFALNNGRVLLEVFDLSTSPAFEDEHDGDAYEFISSHDLYEDCETRLFVLD